jgi:putative ABC transport system ATP-binding protein
MTKPGDQSQSLIRARGVVKDFPLGKQRVRALSNGTLDVAAGEFVVVMGPSGSGKSTLLNLIGGLDRPTGGEIHVDGQDIGHLDENALANYRRRMIGFIFQSFNLVPTMTARQNVEFPMVFAGRSPGQRKDRATSLLKQVGLGHRIGHRPVELSGGEQQRVAIARALANRPQIILGDEPTGNLDTKTGEEVLHILDLLNAAGHTILVVTHDPRLAIYCHRLVQMEDGRMISEEPGGLVRPPSPFQEVQEAPGNARTATPTAPRGEGAIESSTPKISPAPSSR